MVNVNMDLFLGPVGLTLVLGGIAIVLLYRYSVRNFDYWTKRGIPTANTIPLLGSLYEMRKYHFHVLEEMRYKKLGRIYGHFESTSPLLSVADPVLLRDILVKDFPNFHDRRIFRSGMKVLDNMLSAVGGEDWKRIRSIVSPTFSTGKIRRMLSIFKESAKTMCENFESACKDGKSVEAKGFFGAFTMDVIASSAFSTKIDSHNDRDNKFVRMAQKTFNSELTWRFILFFTAPSIMRFFKISVFDKEPMDFFVNVTYQIVEDRRKSGKSRHDFLQLLMDTAKEVSEEEEPEDTKGDITSNYGQEDIEKQILKNVTSKHLSMDELVAQSVIFFLAGYHTTAATLSFATHSLAVNPDVQEKLRKEVDEVLKEHNMQDVFTPTPKRRISFATGFICKMVAKLGKIRSRQKEPEIAAGLKLLGEMTYEAVQSMKYLDNVISETLRMYPPASRLERLATTDYELGDTGITIPKGMVISVPVFAMHRDPEFYPDPEKFDPDRFTPEERNNRDIYTYLPFGAGPRNCVGMRFALMEIKVCLAYVIAKFILKRCPETKVPLDFYFGQGLLQPLSVYIGVEPRTDSPLIE